MGYICWDFAVAVLLLSCLKFCVHNWMVGFGRHGNCCCPLTILSVVIRAEVHSGMISADNFSANISSRIFACHLGLTSCVGECSAPEELLGL